MAGRSDEGRDANPATKVALSIFLATALGNMSCVLAGDKKTWTYRTTSLNNTVVSVVLDGQLLGILSL